MVLSARGEELCSAAPLAEVHVQIPRTGDRGLDSSAAGIRLHAAQRLGALARRHQRVGAHRSASRSVSGRSERDGIEEVERPSPERRMMVYYRTQEQIENERRHDKRDMTWR